MRILFLLLLPFSAMAAPYRPPGSAEVFLEGGTTYAAHYNLSYYDSTPRDSLLYTVRLGLRAYAFSFFYEYDHNYARYYAKNFSGGLRFDLYRTRFTTYGLSVASLSYSNAPPVSPRQTFSSHTHSIRVGAYRKEKITRRSYLILGGDFARISSNLFLLPYVALGMEF